MNRISFAHILIIKKGILRTIHIKQPLIIVYEHENIEEIVEKLEYAIEQHPSILQVIPLEAPI